MGGTSRPGEKRRWFRAFGAQLSLVSMFSSQSLPFSPGTWTFFEHLECNFSSSSTSIWKVLCKTVPRSEIQMEYLVHNFFAHATSWNSLEDTERKLDSYKESIKACLGDAEKGECFEIIHNSDAKAVSVHQNPSGASRVMSLVLRNAFSLFSLSR